MKTKTSTKPFRLDLLCKLDAWWRAANDLSVGQLDLHDNSLLKKSLTLAHCGEIVVALSVYE